MQSWSLDRKIAVSQLRIMEWYQKHDGKAYVSFSGGKDSTVLADLTARVCEACGYKLVLWFSDTGLEYPEIKEHVKSFGEYLKNQYNIEVETIIDYPKDRKGNRISFRDIVINEGYPISSKKVSQCVKGARNGAKFAIALLEGRYTRPDGMKSPFNCEKWNFLLNAPFKISDRCCGIMKKQPAHRFYKESGLLPVIGTMASESMQRTQNWITYGCNIFEGKQPMSRPLSFWTTNDVLKYIETYKLPYPSVYGEIKCNDNGEYYTTGLDRTGCMFCGFGCHLEKKPNRY